MLRRILGVGAAAVVLVAILLMIARGRSSTLRVERTFAAPVERVWQLWNDPEAIAKWWGPKGYSAPVVKNDLRKGGSFLLSMKAPNGEISWNTGTYEEITPHSRIVSSLSFADENGNAIPGSEVPLPGKWPDSVTVTVEFKEAAGKTTVIVTEAGIPMVIKVFAGLGWEQQFDKFEGLL